jgi:hypothetical protein
MEIRGLAIALFYAVGTAVGGITGPLLFGNMIHSGDARLVALGFFVGAAAMGLGGVAELVLGVRAEGKSLENIATPLTAEESDADRPGADRAHRATRDTADPTANGHATATRPAPRAGPTRQGRKPVGLGPGSAFYSPGQIGTAGTVSRWTAASEDALDHEIEVLSRCLERHGPMRRAVLASYLQAQFWGPGRFTVALRYALEEGRVTRTSSGSYGPSETGGGRAPSDRPKPRSAPPVT